MENLKNLVKELSKVPSETQWIEFKHNNEDPEMIGKCISALANAAALNERNKAYMIWGIDDETHNIIGTTFSPVRCKKGNEELENWLRRSLSENADFEFNEVELDKKHIVLLIITRAINKTVMFNKVDFIRIGN